MTENTKDLDEVMEEIFRYLNAVPDIPRNVRGKKFKAPCPCGGTLTVWRVTYNGHIRAKCDKCYFRIME